jgi:alpha-mannosidase
MEVCMPCIMQLLVLSLVLLSFGAFSFDLTKERVQYIVVTSHLDTQWKWTWEKTLRDYIPWTFQGNLNLLKKYPSYVFNWESAWHYMAAKQHHPALFNEIKPFVASGQWVLAGGMLVAPDVNLPSPESLIRQLLYGNRFFQKEFGKRATDMLMPDCFGFGAAFPSVGAHCGMTSFSTQKVYCPWLPQPSGAYPKPFDIGMWKGVDGRGVLAVINPGNYVSGWDIREEQISELGRTTGIFAAVDYMGIGDVGGSPPENDVTSLISRIKQNATMGTKVVLGPSDQIYQDLKNQNLLGKLVSYKGELLAREHGVGTYTAMSIMKLKNRQSEQLGFSAEMASVLAAHTGNQAYPQQKLADAWIRFLWHQMHDDLTGTSIPSVYTNHSLPDLDTSLKEFAQLRDGALTTVAKRLRTDVQGTPVVVFNPLAYPREETVTITVALDKPQVRIFGPDGAEVPAQITARTATGATVLFVAAVPAAGCALYDIRPSDIPSPLTTGLQVSLSELTNNRYTVKIDAAGDISSVFDKKINRELLSAPSQLHLLPDNPGSYPEWEIRYDDITRQPQAIAGNLKKTILENGPVRVALRIEREMNGSKYIQDIRLSAGSAGDHVEVVNNFNWRNSSSLLKAAFPLSSSNTNAAYDLGLGVIERPNRTNLLYEVPAQQWAAITDRSGVFGVAVHNDCKYGWDKPSDNTLRLTLFHSPNTHDLGEHQFTYALYGYRGSWQEGGVIRQAECLNQPLYAIVTDKHSGDLGKKFSFVRVSSPAISLMAMKKAEEGTTYVVRVRETEGKSQSKMRLDFNVPVLSVSEANGMEDRLESNSVTAQDSSIVFDIGAFEPRTFLATLSTSSASRYLSQPPTHLKVRTASIKKMSRTGYQIFLPQGEQTVKTLRICDLRGRIILSRTMTDEEVRTGMILLDIENGFADSIHLLVLDTGTSQIVLRFP